LSFSVCIFQQSRFPFGDAGFAVFIRIRDAHSSAVFQKPFIWLPKLTFLFPFAGLGETNFRFFALCRFFLFDV